MKYLLLPSSFPAWSWEQSNGNATALQTQQAYQALISGGKCADFSRYVWNDLADKVNDALTGAGLSWDSSYCNLYNSKVFTKYGSLTALRFNSLRNNVGKQIYTTWPWTFNPDFTGFVGRDDFIGTVQSADPDEVYGTYIIELARKLNSLISILKNEADFGELQSTVDALAQIVSSDLSVPQANLMQSLLSSTATLSATLERINTQGQLRGHAYGRSAYQAGLELIHLDNVLRAKVKAGIGIDEAAMELFRWYARLRYNGTVLSVVNASIVLSRSKRFSAAIHGTASMRAVTLSMSNLIKRLHTDIKALSKTDTTAKGLPALPVVNTDVISISGNDATLNSIELKAFRAAAISYATLFRRTAKACPANYFVPPAIRLRAAINSDAVSFPAGLLQTEGIAAKADIHSNSVSFPAIAADNTSIEMTSTGTGEIQVSHLVTFNDVTITMFSSNRGTMQTQSPCNMQLPKFNSEARIKPITLIECRPLDVPGASIDASADSTASLGFYGDVWIYPVKAGENLYVRQVYSIKQLDDDLFLDASIPAEMVSVISATASTVANMTAEILWLDPVQTGEDLYIRQVYYSAQTDDELMLYRAWDNPVQTGDILYIRQAEDITQNDNDMEVN